MLLCTLAELAAAAGSINLLAWLTWAVPDVETMQSDFSLFS
ncbi:MAG: hypothetical protein ACK46L_01300 [Synechococcaceae cyanobacterium]|jgi:hypothetical protein